MFTSNCDDMHSPRTYPLCVIGRGPQLAEMSVVACMDLSPMESMCASAIDKHRVWVSGMPNLPIEASEPCGFGFSTKIASCESYDHRSWQLANKLLDEILQDDKDKSINDVRYLRLLLFQLRWIFLSENINQAPMPGLMLFSDEEPIVHCCDFTLQLTAACVADFPAYIAARDRWRVAAIAREAWDRSNNTDEDLASISREFHSSRNARIEKLASEVEVGIGQLLTCAWGPESNPNVGALLLQSPLGNGRWHALLVSNEPRHLQPGDILRQEACWLPPRAWSTLKDTRSIEAVQRDTKLTWVRRPIAYVL